MKVTVVDKEKLDLRHSLLNERDDVNLYSVVDIDGCVVVDGDHKILPIITRYLNKRQHASKSAATTTGTYAKNLIYCLEYLSGRKEFEGFESDQAFLTVEADTLKDYFTWLRNEKKLAATTIRNRDATLKSLFCDFLCKPDRNKKVLREDNPYDEGLLTPSAKSGQIEACDLCELESLMISTPMERERLILQFIFDTGIRRSELTRVTLADIKKAINFQKAQFYGADKNYSVVAQGYAPLNISGSKGRGREVKERTTLISAPTLKRVIAYHASPLYKRYARKFRTPSETPAFFSATGKPFGPRMVDKLLEKTSSTALKYRLIENSISPHKLRHGYAYEVLKSPDFGSNYVDRLIHVQKTLGHARSDSTEVYTQIPVAIYKTMTDERGAILTKSAKMETLYKRTKLKISIRDKR